MRLGWGALAGAIALALATPVAGQDAGTDLRADQVFNQRETMFEEIGALVENRQVDAALSRFDEIVAFVDAELGQSHPLALDTRNIRAGFLLNLDRTDAAEAAFRENIAFGTRMLGEAHPRTIDAMHGLGRVLFDRSRYEEGEEQFAQALDLVVAHADLQNPDVRVRRAEGGRIVNAITTLAVVRGQLGRSAEADDMFTDALQIAEAALSPEDETYLQLQGAYAVNLHALGRTEQAVEIMRRTLPGIERQFGGAHPSYVEALGHQAVMLASLDLLAEAEAVQIEALALSDEVLGELHPRAIDGLSNYATILQRQGRLQLAAQTMETALARHLARNGEGHSQTLRARLAMGNIYQQLGDRRSAEEQYRAVLAQERPGETVSAMAAIEARTSLATINLERGENSQALDALLRAHSASSELFGTEHPQTIRILSNLAVAYEGNGRLADAADAYGRSVSSYRETLGDEHPYTLAASANFGNFHLYSSGRPDLAFVPARFAVRGWRERRDATGDDPASAAQRLRDQQAQVDVFANLLEASWAALQANPDEAGVYEAEVLETMQDLLAGSAGDAIVQAMARRAAADGDTQTAQLITDRERNATALLAIERELADALRGESIVGAERRAALLDRQQQLTESVSTIDLLLQQNAPDYFTLLRPDALDLAGAQAMLAPDEAVTMIVPTASGTHVVAITAEGFRWHRSAMTRTQADAAVRRLQYDLFFDGVASMAEDNRWFAENEAEGELPFNFGTAHYLYQQLFAPLEAELSGKNHVFVMSRGALTGLPMGLLVSDIPEGRTGDAETQRNAPWLADRYALVTVPSLQSIRYIRELATGEGDQAQPFIGIGNPVLEGRPARRGERRSGGSYGRFFDRGQSRGARAVANPADLRNLARLPGTERELQALWQAFGQPQDGLLLGEAASEGAVKQANLDAGVVVFATHGLLARQSGGIGEPGLVLTPPAEATVEDDGYLSMSEVADLRINADWVILSACNTAGGSGDDASGLSGLASAFFFAGAESLLVSHWPVDDDVAARLTVRTVELARDHPELSRAQAFQQAMAEIRNDPDHPEWAHPVAWAPFVLVGDR